MKFDYLISGAEILSRQGDANISGLDYDSRRVQPGYCFVAMRGESTDGNRYIDKAIEKGATAVVTDSAEEQPRQGVAWAQVPHGRRALARLSANFYKRPAEKLRVIGITGTNGKTTTSFLTEAMLAAAGRKSALVGTIEYHIAGRVIPAPHTTPEALELNQVFAEAWGNGATEAVMEVSSHALAQGRVYGVPFDVAMFTNLTRDHLDFHKTMEEYSRAKRILFEGCGTEPPRVTIINADDPAGEELLKFSRKRSQAYSYGLQAGDFHAENLQIAAGGTRFTLSTPAGTAEIWSPLLGKINVYNLLAAAGAAWARGVSLETIARAAGETARVPGRFERVDAGQPFSMVVDYAHTDDALRNVTGLAREFVRQAGANGRVITVFGCGGDRDRTKRPLMGKAAGEGSDYVILTSDNPRSEDPAEILQNVLPGLEPTGTPFAVEADRRAAIALAIAKAQPGDMVILAGKGHEKTQTTREGVFPFDDVQVALEELRGAGYTREKR